jgi:hypothetical protein
MPDKASMAKRTKVNKIADLQSHGDQNYREHHAPETTTECGNTDYRQNSCRKKNEYREAEKAPLQS